MAIGLGRTTPFPFSLGGGDSTVEQEQQAILGALEPGFDISEESGLYWEAYAEAVIVGIIWNSSIRLSNQMIPLKMLENLPTWEESCTLRPYESQTDIDRRKRLNAKLRGLIGNAIGDLADASANVLGTYFVELRQVTAANQITYWPGVNPGPPGYEWSSNRAVVAIEVDNSTLNNNALNDLIDATIIQLDAMAPAWMDFRIGIGTSFIVNQGIVGQNLV
jgi:hypothetical protein